MIKRILVGLLAVIVLAVGGFAGYGWWTRRGAPAFSKGGAFTLASPEASARPDGERVKSPGAGGRDARSGKGARPATTERGTGGTGVTTPAATGTLAVPEAGTYRYEAEGRETIRFGSASPCSWDVNEASLGIKRSRDGVAFDWTYNDNHMERLVMDYGDKRIRLTFAGAAVTCLGVRHTSEEEYTPPSTWMKLPLDPGRAWQQEVRAGDRQEETSVKILRRERVTVPAGTFDTWVVRFTTRLSGSEEGKAQVTHWFVPSLGLSVKEEAETHASRGNIEWDSRLSLRLAHLP